MVQLWFDEGWVRKGLSLRAGLVVMHQPPEARLGGMVKLAQVVSVGVKVMMVLVR